jgi:hypothetical protein
LWPQLPQLLVSVLVSTQVPPMPRNPPHFWPHTLEPMQHPEHVDVVHPLPEASPFPESAGPDDVMHVPPEHVCPIATQSWQLPPAGPHVVSEGDWQLPLVSQQPEHVCAHDAPSPGAASATDPSSPVLLASSWPCASLAPSSPVAESCTPGA